MFIILNLNELVLGEILPTSGTEVLINCGFCCVKASNDVYQSAHFFWVELEAGNSF